MRVSAVRATVRSHGAGGPGTWLGRRSCPRPASPPTRRSKHGDRSHCRHDRQVGLVGRLVCLIRSSEWMLRVLATVRDEHIPDAWIGAGVEDELDDQRGQADLVDVLVASPAPDDEATLVRPRQAIPDRPNAIDPLVMHDRSVGSPTARAASPKSDTGPGTIWAQQPDD